MTVGTKTIGSTNSRHFYQKSWNGSDGRYLNPSAPHDASNMKINPYTMNVVEEFKTPGPQGNYPSRVSWPVLAFTSNDQLAVLSKLSENVRTHDFNMGIALAEGSKTIKLVEKNVVRIALSLRELRRGNFSNAARTLGISKPNSRYTRARNLQTSDVSSLWLELQYGWRPLLSDVYEGAKAFASIANHPRTKRYSASRKISTTFKSSNINLDHVGRVDVTRKITYLATETLSTPRSLGLMDPLSVAWEVVPYSFVIDWFVPVGTYLESYNTIPRLTGRFFTTDRTVRRQVYVNRAGKPGFQAAFWAGSRGISTDFNLTRTYSTSLSVPLPTFNPLSQALSPLRVANAIALARQLIK
nr:MAG: maturation protein [Leviviridae sp.]